MTTPSKTGSLTVGRVLALGFAITLLMMLILSVVGMLRVNVIAQNLTEIADSHSVKQRHAINFRGSVHDRAIALRDIPLVYTDAELRAVLAEIERLAADYERNARQLDAIFAAGGTTEGREAYGRIKAVEARALPLVGQIVAAHRANDAEQVRQLLVQQAGPLFSQWLATINQFIELQESRIQTAASKALSVATSFQMQMIVLCVIALLLGATQAGLITRWLLRQLGAEPRQVRQLANTVGSGDLRIDERYRSAPQGSIMASVVAMADHLNEVVSGSRNIAQTVAAATQQLSERSNDLLARTENQASALTETASAMEQLGGTVEQNADNASQADRHAASALEVARRGGQLMQTVIDTMGNINNRSRQIADIISIIDGIAFQTNILALNASVEAARASEQGRGFAVVASEVRSLAQRSADAAKDIKSLLSENLQWVESGTRQVDEAGHTTAEIVDSITRVSQLMNQISHASAEQSSGVQQVSRAVVEMDQDTERNRIFVQESVRASMHLREQADQLARAMAQFRLAGDTDGGAEEHAGHVRRALPTGRPTLPSPA